MLADCASRPPLGTIPNRLGRNPEVVATNQGCDAKAQDRLEQVDDHAHESECQLHNPGRECEWKRDEHQQEAARLGEQLGRIENTAFPVVFRFDHAAPFYSRKHSTDQVVSQLIWRKQVKTDMSPERTTCRATGYVLLSGKTRRLFDFVLLEAPDDEPQILDTPAGRDERGLPGGATLAKSMTSSPPCTEAVASMQPLLNSRTSMSSSSSGRSTTRVK